MAEATEMQEAQEAEQLWLFEAPVHVVKTSLTFAGDRIVFDAPAALGDVVRFKGTAVFKHAKHTDENGVVTERRILVSDEVTIIA